MYRDAFVLITGASASAVAIHDGESERGAVVLPTIKLAGSIGVPAFSAGLALVSYILVSSGPLTGESRNVGSLYQSGCAGDSSADSSATVLVCCGDASSSKTVGGVSGGVVVVVVVGPFCTDKEEGSCSRFGGDGEGYTPSGPTT